MLNFLKCALLFAGILLLPPVVQAKDPIRIIEGFVSKVSDGDTIHVNDSLGTKIKIRLYGIDAPETEKSNKQTGKVSKPGQPFGEEAFQALNSKIFKKRVKVEVIDIDRYKRLVSVILLDGRNINKEMVAEGYAWAYRQYLDRPHASEYIQAEEQARAKRLGLWQQNNPQPPWDFRSSLRKVHNGR
jgi:micrococcal nuclease